MGRPSTDHTPQRMCRVCRGIFSKRELERWIVKSGELILDSRQTLEGRGWYSCQQATCSRRVGPIALGQSRSRIIRKEAQA
ncbi:MAG: DUF448 domain-containing protein [bacterium]